MHLLGEHFKKSDSKKSQETLSSRAKEKFRDY